MVSRPREAGARDIDRVRLTPEFNPGQARWCTRCRFEGRMECTRQKRTGGPCHSPAIRGTNACGTHGGRSRQELIARGDLAIMGAMQQAKEVVKVGPELRITAWSAEGSLEGAIDYRMAVLKILQMSWLRLHDYSEKLRRQVEKASTPPPGEPSIEDLFEGPDMGGLIGHRYGAAGKDGIIYAQNEEIRALVQLEAQERDRIIMYAQVAHKMGIDDRLTDLAERWADSVVTQINAMFDVLGLSAEQKQQLPTLIESYLGSVDIALPGAGR